MQLQPEQRALRVQDRLIEIDEPDRYKYFEALPRDYEQVPRQQLRPGNKQLDPISPVKEEVLLAPYHSVVDRCVTSNGVRASASRLT